MLMSGEQIVVRQGASRDTSQEATAKILTNYRALKQESSRGDVEKWSDSEYILKVDSKKIC